MTTELLFRGDAYLQSATARVVSVGERGIELDRTLFYPVGGGQPGDTGRLVRHNGETVAVVDTRKGETVDSVMHVLAPGSPPLEIGEAVTLNLDWQRRYALMRLHTALHVMSCVVIAPVTGGNIAPDKARLDFDIDMERLNAAHIETETNALIARSVQTETVWITDAELDARPELVKTMSVQPPRGAGRVRLLSIPGIDLQPCGGTHVLNIGEIGGITCCASRARASAIAGSRSRWRADRARSRPRSGRPGYSTRGRASKNVANTSAPTIPTAAASTNAAEYDPVTSTSQPVRPTPMMPGNVAMPFTTPEINPP